MNHPPPTTSSAPDAALVAVEHRSWPADPHQLASIRAEVRRWLGSSGLGDDLVEDLVLAVSEAASNAVEHAYRPVTPASDVEVIMRVREAAIGIEIVDHGRWQPPTRQDTCRGRGITLIRQLVDSVTVHVGTAGTRVLLHHQMPGAHPGASPPNTT